MPTRNINLTTALDRFVGELIEGGGFQNASEVVRAGLRLLVAEADARAAKVAALRAAIQMAEDDLAAGRYEDVTDVGAWLDEIETAVEAELTAETSAARIQAE